MTLRENYLDQISPLFDEEITEDTLLVEDLNITSIQFMFMVNTIKELTGKKYAYSEIKKCRTIGDTCDLCEKGAK